MGREDTSWAGFGGTALVAAPPGNDTDELCAILRDAGYAAVVVASTTALLGTLRQTTPDVIFLDAALAPECGRDLAGAVESDHRLAGLPVILLLPDTGLADPTGPLEQPVTDFVFRPFDRRDIVQRAGSAIARRRNHRVQREAASLLREQMREISAGIRATNSPVAMVENFLRGLGLALGSDFVVLQIFADERVPDLSSSWAHPSAGRLQVPALARSGRARSLAVRLWEDSAGERLPLAANAPDDFDEVDDEIGSDTDGDGIVSGVVLAVGEGATPFGLVWLINNRKPLEWTPVENSLTQHVLGNFAHGLIQGQLITRQQQAVEKLRRLNKAKSDFVGTVNHELRTPLASMAGYLEMILDGSGGQLPDAARNMLEAVERNTTRLRSLIENITALTPTNDDALAQFPVDIYGAVSDAVAASRAAAAAKGLELYFSVPEEKITVAGNRDQLQEALGIIVSNAVKFTSSGGRVEVNAGSRADRGMVEVEVRDTGIGIPDDDLPRLFDSFYRGSNASETAIPGVGVGLAIAKRTLEAHSGSISIESSVGQGTKVSVLLPVGAGPEPARG